MANTVRTSRTTVSDEPTAIVAEAVTWTLGPSAPLRMLATKEACQILGISRSSLHRAIHEHGFPRPVQIFGKSRAARFDSTAVWRWLEPRLNRNDQAA